MPTSPTPERLAILVLIIASVVAACDRKQHDGTKSKSETPRAGGKLPPVVPALGIRG